MVAIGSFFSVSVPITSGRFVGIFVIFDRVIDFFGTLHQEVDAIADCRTYLLQRVFHVFFAERRVRNVDGEFILCQSARRLVHVVQVERIDVENANTIAYLQARKFANWQLQRYYICRRVGLRTIEY